MRNVAINVQEAVVPHAGHWLMEDSPAYTVKLIRTFPESSAAASLQRHDFRSDVADPDQPSADAFVS